jgi:hypothetical protein
MNSSRVTTGIDSKASQLQNRLGGPPNELILLSPTPCTDLNRTRFSSRLQSLSGLHFGFCGSEGNEELEAGFEVLGNEGVDGGGLGLGPEEREQV